MANKKRYTAKQVADALVTTRGYVSKAAELLGCHVTTVYDYAKRYDIVQDAVTANRESRHDFVENKLMKAIDADNVTAMIFYLKTQGRQRGWGEHLQIDWHKAIENEGVPPEVAAAIFEADVEAMLGIMTGDNADKDV